MDDSTTPEQFSLRSGLQLTVAAPDAIISSAVAMLSASPHIKICTVNPEIYVRALRDPDYMRLVQQSTIRTADGIGISLAAFRQRGRFINRTTGVSLVEAAIAFSSSTGRPIIILGASPLSRQRAEAVMRMRGAHVLDGHSPPIAREVDLSACIDVVWPPGALVLVAMGAPKQEQLISALSHSHPSAVFVGVGGAIDYLSGTAKAPHRIVRALGLEWFHRLIFNPRLRFTRQVRSIPLFVLRELL